MLKRLGRRHFGSEIGIAEMERVTAECVVDIDPCRAGAAVPRRGFGFDVPPRVGRHDERPCGSKEQPKVERAGHVGFVVSSIMPLPVI